MTSNRAKIISASLMLGLFSVVGIGLVAFTHANTKDRIAANERAFVLKSLRELVPDNWHDNDLLADQIRTRDRDAFGNDEPVTIYRARMGANPVAAILTPTAPDGYNGAIRLLVAIDTDNTLIGVRAIRHAETPGLGDAIDTNKSDWILGFNGKSLLNPPPSKWAVKKDGGDFDQITGATITPRAIVKTVARTLVFFKDNQEQMFWWPSNDQKQQVSKRP